MKVVVTRCDQHRSKCTTDLTFYLTVNCLPPFDIVFYQHKVVTLVTTPEVPYCEVSYNNYQKGGS